MKIAWISLGSVRDPTSGRTIPADTIESKGTWTSTFASVRLRALVPMRELAARGHDVHLLQVDPENLDACSKRLAEFDVVVFKKVPPYGAAILELFRRAQSGGIPTAFDLCDLHVDPNSEIGRLNLELLRGADILVASSLELARELEAAVGRTADVIDDPYEGPRGTPTPPGTSGPLKLLWFGHPANLDTLEGLVAELVAFGASRPSILTIMTGPVPVLVERCKQFNQRWRHVLSMRYEPWSQTALWTRLAQSDAIVIPTRADLQTKRVKTANRMVESLWAGRCVVATPLPAYLPFADWAFLDESIGHGLARALAVHNEIPARIGAAQRYIEEVHAPGTIASRWESVLQRRV